MRRFLGLSAADQTLTFEQAGARKGLTPSSVEKDFWVSWTLRELFGLPSLADRLTFKGGTSLSKAWSLIDRFSEDIDLTIHRESLGFGAPNDPEAAKSKTQRGVRMKALVAACGAHVGSRVLPELAATIDAALAGRPWDLSPDPDDPDAQTLLYRYPSLFPVSQARYLRPVVKIEFGARSDPSPSETRTIRPLVAEVFPRAFEDAECPVRALSPLRTFWEKAMLLHEETYRPAHKPRRPRMARHYYDVHRLIDRGIARDACADPALFDRVIQHRRLFFAQNWVDYATLRPGTLRLGPAAAHEDAWRADYGAMEREMFTAPPPSFDTILASVRAFETWFNARATP